MSSEACKQGDLGAVYAKFFVITTRAKSQDRQVCQKHMDFQHKDPAWSITICGSK